MKASDLAKYTAVSVFNATGRWSGDDVGVHLMADVEAYAKEAEEEKLMGERWHRAAKELMQTNTALQTRLDEAVAVLKPFALFAEEYIGHSKGTPRDGVIYGIDFTGTGGKTITVEMLKAASDFISKAKAGGK